MNTFKADIEEIRRRAREKMEDGGSPRCQP